MAQTTNQRGKHDSLLDGILKVGRFIGVLLLPLVFLVGFVVWCVIAFNAVEHLGEFHFALQPPMPTFTAVAVVALALVLAAYLAATARLDKNVSRSVALAAFIGWLAVMLLLALLDMGLTSGAIRYSDEATEDAWRINISPELLEISKFIYGAIAALPIVIGLVLWAVHSSEQTGKYTTLSHGAKATGWFVLKLALAVAMFSFEAFFGLSAGYSPLMAIPAALLNAIVFTVALNEVRAATDDKSRARLWAVVALVYAALMFCIAYEVGLKFGGEAAFPYAPRPEWLRAIAETGFLSSIGLSALILALARIAAYRGRDTTPLPDGVVEGVTITRPERAALPTRAAGYIRSQREGWGDLRQAMKGDKATVKQPAQIGASAATAVAKVAKDAPGTRAPAVAELSDVGNVGNTGADGAARNPKSGGN